MNKVFSGIRPSGKLHLGNYLGAIKNWIELQDAEPSTGLRPSQAIFAVVDYHGITTPFDPKTYHEQVMDVVIDYLAAGVDPDKALLIRQSKVPQHTELAWIFNTITPVGWLERLPNYGEKLRQVAEMTPSMMASGFVPSGKKTIDHAREVMQEELNKKSYQNTLGLLAYPVLMAADILIYKSNFVPVGDDQKQHIDITNEIGSKFNFLFGQTFEPVKAHMAGGARIMSLKDPLKKMSKTGDEGIALSDSATDIKKKIMSATTDSGKEVLYDEGKKPGISNLMDIYALLSPNIKNLKQIEIMYEGKSYAEFKSDLAEVVVNFLEPFQMRYAELKADPGHVLQILERSEERARKLASATLNEVKEKMGF